MPEGAGWRGHASRRSLHEQSSPCRFRSLDRRRAGARGAVAVGAGAGRQSAASREGQHGADGEGQAGEVLRHQRRGEERLCRGRAFLRRPGDAGARSQVVRAAAGRRLRQDPGRQDDRRPEGTMSLPAKPSRSCPGESRDRVALPASRGGAGASPRRGVDGGAHRELHGRRHGDALSRSHSPRPSDFAARRRAVARQRRGTRSGASRAHSQGRRTHRARPDVGAHRVERRGRRPISPISCRCR